MDKQDDKEKIKETDNQVQDQDLDAFMNEPMPPMVEETPAEFESETEPEEPESEASETEPTPDPEAEPETNTESNEQPADAPKPANKKHKKAIIIGAIIGALAIIATCLYLFVWPMFNKKTVVKPADISDSKFAAYEQPSTNIVPEVPEYTINKDLSNVTNITDFIPGYINENDQTVLAKNSFVVSPGYNNEFFPIYESNRYSYIPNFVTTDSILHNYHLMFDFLLRQVEEQKLSVQLKSFNASMLAEAKSQYGDVKGTKWENAAKRNLAYFTVGSKLLDPTVTVPAEVEKVVTQELALIDAHTNNMEASPVMNIGSNPSILEALKEDYTQYIPRGHYDKTDKLKAYFKSMMWYGRMTFRFKSDDEIKSSVLITLALKKEPSQTSWNNIYEPTNFFVGKSDDIGYNQFKDIFATVYGADATAKTIAGDDAKFTSFKASTEALEPPQINSMPIFNEDIQPDRTAEIKGFRVMGQRFTIDASIFQRLVDRETKDRMLPKGLDIPAAMGSQEALDILTELGETKYEHYSDNMTKMKAYIADLPTANWTQNLYWGWMFQLRPLLEERSTGYPTFMQNDAWVRKDLNTFLGSWTELKHDTILYAKQTYAEAGGVMPEEKDDRGYVEPNVEVYARLASLLKMTNDGLATRDMIPENLSDDLVKMKTLVDSLKTISEKELKSQALTDDEYELIRSYGAQLEHFWTEINKDEPEYKQLRQKDYLSQNPAAIVSDVATNPADGTVLEVATGDISDIYVIVPIDGKLRVARGGVYSYYEFTQPASERLTDAAWREMLNGENVPEMPGWTNSFIVK